MPRPNAIANAPLEGPASQPRGAQILSVADLCYDVAMPGRDKRTRLPVLQDISLELYAGETVALMGPSGSGKTSLLMLIAGLEAPTKGTIVFRGKNLNQLGEKGRALLRRDAMGLVFQDFHLSSTMTALENVALPLEFAGCFDAFVRAESMLKAVGLEARMAHNVTDLSGGEKQRVALARALVSRPGLLMADEPTGNLDAGNGALVTQLLFDLTRAVGGCLLLVTHDPRLAQRCGRVLTLQDGRLGA